MIELALGSIFAAFSYIIKAWKWTYLLVIKSRMAFKKNIDRSGGILNIRKFVN